MASTITLPIRNTRRGRVALQDLPEEIQGLIYEFALVELPRWEKRHSLNCQYAPIKAHRMEPPPFALTRVELSHNGKEIETTQSECACAKRKGLSLLLASRDINRMASTIFWSKNTFCFMNAFEFIAAVNHTLRSECRSMIRSLSIISPDRKGIPKHVNVNRYRPDFMDRFWVTLKECHSLSKLEISPSFLQPSKKCATQEHLDDLADFLPYLPNIRLTFLHTICENYSGLEYPPPYFNEWHHQSVYIKCSRRLDFNREEYWTADELENIVRSFDMNFRIYVDTASKVKFLGANIDKLQDYRESWNIKSTLNENSYTRRITLPTGEDTVVKIFGLPLSTKARSTRARNAKLEFLKKDRHPDGSRVSEHNAMKTGQGRRRRSRKEQLTKEREEYEESVSARETRRAGLKEEEEEANREATRREKELLRNKVAAAEDNRRLERKRASRWQLDVNRSVCV